MLFLQFSAVSWVHLCLSTHQSQGNSEDTQAVHELEVVDMKTKVDKFKPVRVAVEEGEVGGNKVGTLLNTDGELAREVGLSAWDDWQ